jgi:hypothetical protein
MSGFHSDKCSPEELKKFKKEVIDFLEKEGINTKKLKIRALRCYNGDVRIYTGHMELQNSKESFRRTEADKDSTGKIIGWMGTRGKHFTKIPEYINFNRDEFPLSDFYLDEWEWEKEKLNNLIK